MVIKWAKFSFILFFTSITFSCAQVVSRQPRIEGDIPQPSEFKYVVMIRREVNGYDYPLCTGGIVSENLILTAAHCALNKTTNEFKNGRIRVIEGKDQIVAEDKRKGIPVKTMMVPESYNARTTRSEGDIGLMRLSEDLSGWVEKLSLPITGFEQFGSEPLKFAGYGAIEVVYKNGTYIQQRTRKERMQKADMTVTACHYDWSHVVNNTFCAQINNYHNRVQIGICYGNSGEPLVYHKVIVGIASFADESCNERIRSWVFTQVSGYTDDIKRAIKGEMLWRFKHANKDGYF